jgi:hypothetical protein
MSFRLQYSTSSLTQMPCYAPGVRFNDCLFSEPATLAAWRPSVCAGILAILVRNPQWGPRPLQPLYFGEFGNDAARGTSLPANVHREDLLVSVLPMPYSTAAQRRAVCDDLIAAHNPVWQANRGVVPAAELARKVDELSARQQEQSQQILSLLAHLAKLFAPQPVSPRKPIGFLAELTATAAPATES